MPRISMGGVNSGLPPNLVEQIMVEERKPLQQMEQKKAKLDVKLNLVNDLEGRIRGMKASLENIFGRRGIESFKLNTNQENVFLGDVDLANVNRGSWEIQVKKKPERGSAISNGFPDKDKTSVGVGYFRFETPNGQKKIYINESNNTLSGVASTLNRSDIGLRASVVRDASDSKNPYRLILGSTSDRVTENIEYPSIYLLEGERDLFIEKRTRGSNGLISVDGFDIEVDSAKIEGLIPGVTLDISKADITQPISVKIEEDYELVGSKIEEFVAATKNVLSFIQSQNRMDENTDTSQTLGGDSSLRTIESQVRSLLLGPIASAFDLDDGMQRLTDFGIEFNRDGNINFQKEKFSAVLAETPQEVIDFFRGDGGLESGFIGKVRSFVNSATKSFGILDSKKKGLQSRSRRIDKNIAERERRLDKKEDMLRRKFTRLEETLGKIKGQGNALAQNGLTGQV